MSLEVKDSNNSTTLHSQSNTLLMRGTRDGAFYRGQPRARAVPQQLYTVGLLIFAPILALKNLGFGKDYLEACNSVLGECSVAAEKRLMRKNSRLDRWFEFHQFPIHHQQHQQ